MGNHLPDSFYTMPRVAHTTMKRKELSETLLATDGAILTCGRMRDVKSKSLGAGVYRVFLEGNEFYDMKGEK